MFHLIQQDPGESVLLGTYESKQTALFKLGQMQMRNPHCFYEIMTTDEVKLMNTDNLASARLLDKWNNSFEVIPSGSKIES